MLKKEQYLSGTTTLEALTADALFITFDAAARSQRNNRTEQTPAKTTKLIDGDAKLISMITTDVEIR